MAHHFIPASHFNKKTLRALTASGITLLSTTYLPDEKGDFANGQTGYNLDNNGQGQVRTYLEVLALVA
jgi:hypothetical protein